MGTGNYSATSNDTKLVHWHVGCYIWYSEERTGLGRCTNGQCTITVFLYNGPLLCGFNVLPVKGFNTLSYLDGFVLQSQPVKRVDGFASAVSTAVVDEPVAETLTCIGISIISRISSSNKAREPASQLLIIISCLTRWLVDSHQQQRTNVAAFTRAATARVVTV